MGFEQHVAARRLDDPYAIVEQRRGALVHHVHHRYRAAEGLNQAAAVRGAVLPFAMFGPGERPDFPSEAQTSLSESQEADEGPRPVRVDYRRPKRFAAVYSDRIVVGVEHLERGAVRMLFLDRENGRTSSVDDNPIWKSENWISSMQSLEFCPVSQV